MNWDSKLITKPLKVTSGYPVYLEYDYDISLKTSRYPQPEHIMGGFRELAKTFTSTTPSTIIKKAHHLLVTY